MAAKQHGAIQIYAILAIAAVLSGVGLYALGRSDGRDMERKATLAQKLKDQAAYAAEKARLQEEVRGKEEAYAKASSAADAAYEKGRRDGTVQTKRDLAAIRTGDLVLRDPGGGRAPSGGGIRSPGAPTGKCDAEAGTRLSPEAAEFLLSLTGEADEVVKQLTACQVLLDAVQQVFNSLKEPSHDREIP
jgi:prophage endopeptidase